MQSKPLFQIALPLATNDGITYAKAVGKFEEFVAQISGGLTSVTDDAVGVWIDKGKRYSEAVELLQFTVDTADDLAKVKAEFWRLFPDQLAMAIAQIGYLTIERRPNA